ncbi:MAG: DNA translocase FtsK, partial [Actinobacteria bacterium]|nr:DNA translocase FtsK [Actinomycetota bacterium]NIS36461.1 DNA translocase FtsK [Actinomycetota bacterium]NIT98713.1 DNA translocase FtsK [Actinomycetota bacterium]NIU22347.1 DNA translocase FtsK [Actinomycetota bacterium]NIU70970.1 DNA translocase FtsK [Actinomycetota bacterium]
ALIRGDDVTEDDTEPLARIAVGGIVLVVALSALLHVVRGRPGIDDPVGELGAAGGVLGMVVGGPLHAATAVVGSVLILGVVAMAGVIVVTGSSARAVGSGALQLVRPVPVLFMRGLRSLFRDPSTPDVIDLRDRSGPFDQDADGPGDRAESADPEPEEEKPKRRRAAKAEEPPRDVEQQALPMDPGDWTLPPSSLLARSDRQEVDATQVVERGRLLQATLAQFDVHTTLLDPIVGPTVTRYVLELGEGVKVSKLENLRKDIAYAMASPDVRILAPIPGRRAIGVEVPNTRRDIITVGDILASKEARQASHPLEVAIGRDINGRNMMVNLATMPHVLISGATGSGKSS